MIRHSKVPSGSVLSGSDVSGRVCTGSKSFSVKTSGAGSGMEEQGWSLRSQGLRRLETLRGT